MLGLETGVEFAAETTYPWLSASGIHFPPVCSHDHGIASYSISPETGPHAIKMGCFEGR